MVDLLRKLGSFLSGNTWGGGSVFWVRFFLLQILNYGNFVIIESCIAAEEVELATDYRLSLSIYCSPASQYYG